MATQPVSSISRYIDRYRALSNKREEVQAEIDRIQATIAEEIYGLKSTLGDIDNDVEVIRAAISGILYANGETSFTDPDTKFNARIEKRSNYVVADRDELFAAALENPDLDLLVTTVDTKKAIAHSKEAGELLPGIVVDVRENLSIHPPKAKKGE